MNVPTLVRNVLLLAALGFAAILLPACDQSDASSLKLTLKADLSGDILSSSVAIRDAADGPVQKVSAGANWKAAGTVIVSKGDFADITKLDIGGIKFASGARGGAPILSVTLARGPGAKWPAAFTATDREARKTAARTLDPASKASSIGENIKIQITVPGVVVSAGTDNKERGVNSSYEETSATLMIPVGVATANGPPIVWHITWKEQSVP